MYLSVMMEKQTARCCAVCWVARWTRLRAYAAVPFQIRDTRQFRRIRLPPSVCLSPQAHLMNTSQDPLFLSRQSTSKSRLMSAAIPDQDPLASGRHTAQQKLRDPDSTSFCVLSIEIFPQSLIDYSTPENPRIYIKDGC